MKKIIYVEPSCEEPCTFKRLSDEEKLHIAKNENLMHIYDTIEDFAEAFNNFYVSDEGYMYIVNI